MGALVTVAESAFLVRKNERAVRWHIGKGHLTPQTGDDGHMRLDTDELATVRGWRVDEARLGELLDEQGRTHIALADRVKLLERRLDRLERRVTQLSRSDGQEVAADDQGAMVTPVNAPRPSGGRVVSADDDVSRGTDTLPSQLVSVASFAARHGVPETTAVKALDTGRLPSVSGRWKQGRAWVAHALDADGRRAFYRLWGNRDDFRRCADCPHT